MKEDELLKKVLTILNNKTDGVSVKDLQTELNVPAA